MMHAIIENEVSVGPLFCRDEDDWILDRPFDVIENDKTAMDLIEKISKLYDSYFEPNSHDEPLWFNEEQQKKDAPIMLDLIAQLKTRLEEINDGSYEVLDYETEKLLRLQAGGDYFIP